MENCTELKDDAHLNSTMFGRICPSEELAWWVAVIEISYLSIITAIGIPGNCFIIYAHKMNREKSSTDYLIAVMAMYELFCSTVNSLTKIFQNTKAWEYIASDTVCRIHMVFMYITAFASPYLLAAIAVDRYFKTCQPLRNMYTIRTSKIICVIVSIAAFLTGWTTLLTFEVDETFTCVIAKENVDFQLKWDMVVVSSTAIVFAIFIFSYVNIGIELHRRIRARRRPRKQNGEDSSTTFSDRHPLVAVWKRLKSKVEPVRGSSQQTASVDQVRGKCNQDSVVAFQTCDSSVQDSNTNQGPQHNIRADSRCTSYTVATVPRDPTYIERTVNRTTLIMFLLTLIYAVTYAIVNTSIMTSDTLLGRSMEKLCKSLLMVNCISNPILFFCMSSKYRSTAKNLFLKLGRY